MKMLSSHLSGFRLASFTLILVCISITNAFGYGMTSIGGAGWSGTLNYGSNSTIYVCNGSGVIINTDVPASTNVSGTIYYRKWQTSSDGISWFTTVYGGSGSPSTNPTTSTYYRCVLRSTSLVVLPGSETPWVYVVVGPSFISSVSGLSLSTSNITPTSFTVNFTTSSSPHGPGNLCVRHYLFVSSTPTYDPNTQPTGGVFNSACAALMTSCSDVTSAIPGCTAPSTAVSYNVTGLTSGVTYYWKVLAQTYHENTSNGDLFCGYQIFTGSQIVTNCAAPVVTLQPATQAVCSGNTGTLSVTATGATGYQWQLNGTDIPGATSSLYGATLAGNYSCWVYSACDSSLTNVAVITLDQSTTAAAGPDQSICTNSATLAANAPLTGTGTWSVITGSGTFVNASDPNTTVNALGNGTNTFRWTVLNGACSDSQDDVTITVQTASIDPIGISGVASICNGSSTSLSVNGGSLGSGANWEWYTGSCGTGTHVGSGTTVSFSPSSNTTYYVFAQGGCNTTTCVSLPVDVTAISADAGSNQTMCSGDSVTLTASGTGTYVWSQGGLTTPSIVVKPAVNTTYTVTVTNGGCTATDTVLVSVTSFADATITSTGTYCTGQTPFIINAVNAGGSWSGTGITNSSTGLFSPAIAGPGPHQIIHTISGSCGDTDTAIITVATSANASINPSGPFCSDALPITLTAADAGGTWSGLGITNGATGTFSPALVGSGSYSIVYTISGSCGESDTVTIVVNAAPDATITTAGPICTGQGSLLLSAVDAGGSWSGPGITNVTTGQFNPALVGPGTYQIVYTITGSCGDADTASITVTGSADATITSAGPFCSNLSSVTLTAADTGGTWIGFGITDANAGTFSPSAMGVGSYNVIYSIPGSCGSSDTASISVTSALDVTITPAGSFCSNISSVTLQAATTGGTWSGQGIINPLTGQFSPSGVGSGTYNVIYTLAGACGGSDTLAITVGDASNASITSAGPFCYSDGAVTLTAVDPGGIWSGNGITNANTGAFDPALAGTGSHLISYMISGACGDTGTLIIVVDSLFDASITSPLTYCNNLSPFALSATTTGGIWTGTGITNAATGLFSPTLAGTGDHSIIYAIAGSCGSSDTVNIHINSAPALGVSSTTEQCIGSLDGSATATGSGGTEPLTYSWSNGDNTAIINQLAPGTYTVILTDANGCQRIDSVILEASTTACEDVISVIYIPNIFSPNGDGDPRNNTLGVIGEGIRNVLFTVYDRWGEKIFESQIQSIGWDGTYKGKDMDQGVYVYMAVIELLNGEMITRKGNVTLVR